MKLKYRQDTTDSEKDYHLIAGQIVLGGMQTGRKPGVLIPLFKP
jgi:hypothetical protein